jgi:hypothetical protein
VNTEIALMYMKKKPIVSAVTWNRTLRKSASTVLTPWNAPIAIA